MATDNLMPQSSTSVIKHFMLRSSTTGQGLTGKVAADFSGKYNIAGGAEVTLSFSSGTPGDAYSSGKIVPLGLGKYAWHVPNAVFASLGNVSAVLSVSGGIDVHCEWLVVAAVRDTAAFGASTLSQGTALTRGLIAGVVDTGSSATVVYVSSIESGLAVTDQVKGRVLIFDKDTTTAALRGQGAPIDTNDTSSITVASGDAFTTSPVSGDTFTIY